MKRRLAWFPLLMFAVFSLLPARTALAAETAPDVLIKSTVDDVLLVIRQQARDKRALRQLAEDRIVPRFDFRRMTQLAVGPAWRQANPTQQQALEDGFRTLLVNTYTSALALSATGNPVVDVKPAQINSEDALVKTVVRDSGRQPVAIDYRLGRSPEGWKVYDVSVENLSIVTNYRGSFAGEIGRTGIDGLIQSLKEKNRNLAAG